MTNFDKVDLVVPPEGPVICDAMEDCYLFLFTDCVLVCTKSTEQQRQQYLMAKQSKRDSTSRRSSRRKSAPIDTNAGPQYAIITGQQLDEVLVCHKKTYVITTPDSGSAKNWTTQFKDVLASTSIAPQRIIQRKLLSRSGF